jgi:hypothetical protein
MDDDQTILFNFYQSLLVFIQMTLEFKKLSANQTQQSIVIFLDKLTEAHTQIVLNLEKIKTHPNEEVQAYFFKNDTGRFSLYYLVLMS